MKRLIGTKKESVRMRFIKKSFLDFFMPGQVVPKRKRKALLFFPWFGLFLFLSLGSQVVEAQEMTASWYSVQSLKEEGTYKYSKGVMANGEHFNDMASTCAVRFYNLGDTLRVVSLVTGKSVIVKVTDRIGRRFAGTRIDLSKRAFEILSGGQLNRGLLRVRIERIK